jgi:hypothetical protein
MANHNFDNVQVYAYLEEDAGDTREGTNLGPYEPGAGFIVAGFVIDGVRVPVIRKKAGGFLDDRARHQQAQP